MFTLFCFCCTQQSVPMSTSNVPVSILLPTDDSASIDIRINNASKDGDKVLNTILPLLGEKEHDIQ